MTKPLEFSAFDLQSYLDARAPGLDSQSLSVAKEILDAIRLDHRALERYAQELDGIPPGMSLCYDHQALEQAYLELPDTERSLIDRCAQRVERFALAQRSTLIDLDTPIQGGRAGHRFVPYKRAGCYAPGGRFQLPSSVLMTAIPAKVAGVDEIWVASPRPGPMMKAAAFRGGAVGMLAVGGAQAIGAMAYGMAGCPQCEIVVGPGNRYVTAAKSLLRDQIAIDMLAGPSELVVLADESADPGLVAADLLAQAEHDPLALPILITPSPKLVTQTRQCIGRALDDLPTQDIAREALSHGGYLLTDSLDEALALCEQIAPEHLEILVEDSEVAASRLSRYGALFIGSASAEVMGDYGAGPNHVLPTGGSAKRRGGLSILDFLAMRSWMQLDSTAAGYDALLQDSVDLARLEGLEGHARSAECRKCDP